MSQLNVTNSPQGNVPADNTDNTNHVNAPVGQPPADLNNAHIGNPQQPRVTDAMHSNPLPDPRTVQLRGIGVNAGPQPAIGQQRTTSGEQVAHTAVRSAAAELHQALDDAQIPLVLKLLYKEIPGLENKVHSGNVGAIEAAIKGAGDKLATLVRNLPFHAAWEDSRERRAQLFAFQSRLDEATVQAAFFASPEVGKTLANAYADLEEGKRPAPGTGDFDAWCDREIASMLEAKLFAIRDLRKADLPEGAKHALLDKLLSGAVAGELGTFVATNAGPIAAKLNVDMLKNALRPLENGGQVGNAPLLAALEAIDEQIPQILPALITYTLEERALLRDTVLQAFVQQHGELADLLARLPAAQVQELGQQPGMTPERLGLLHAARGRAADAWLSTNIADDIRTGSASLGTQRMLENVLRYGPELFRPHRKLPAHLHGMLRRFIGAQNLGTEQSRQDAAALVARMARDMTHWTDFTPKQCPQSLSSYLTTQVTTMVGNYVKDAQTLAQNYTDNIFTGLPKDVFRSLYSLNGTSFHHQKHLEDGFLPTLRESVKGEKSLRFLSAVMQQGAWAPLLNIAERIPTVPQQLYGDKSMQKLINRSMNDYMANILSGTGTDMTCELRVAPDGKSAQLRMFKPFMLQPGGPEQHAGVFFGRVEMTQEMTISLENDDPRITDYTVSQRFVPLRGEV